MNTAPALALCALLAPVALAQLHDSDIVLQLHDGRITTSAVVPNSAPQALATQRVFRATLEDVGGIFFTQDPGLDSPTGTFPPFAQVSFTILDALRAFDGTDFDQLAQPRLRIRFGAQQTFTPDTLGAMQAGFGVSATSNGTFHRHLGFTLLDQPDPGVEPPDGLYLLQLTLAGTAPGAGTSRPFALVFNKNRPTAEHDAALRAAALLLCPADIAGPGQSPAPDDQLTADDLIVFVSRFFALDARADIAGSGQTPAPDGQFTADDLIRFVNLFFAGC